MEDHRSRSVAWKRSDLLQYVAQIGKWIPKTIDAAWKTVGAMARLLAIVLFCAAVTYSWREFRRDLIIIEPIGVPKLYADAGVTPDVMANRVKDILAEMEGSITATGAQKDRISRQSEGPQLPHIEVPGTGLQLDSVIDIARRIVPVAKQPTRIGGEITLSSASLNSADTILVSQNKPQSMAQIALRITGVAEPILISVPSDDSMAVAEHAAQTALRQINPYLLALYLYDRKDFISANAVAEGIIRDPAQDRRHVSAAIELSGFVLDAQKKYDGAIAKYQEAMRKDPTYAFSAYDSWAWVLYEQKRYDEAIGKCQKAIEIRPKYAWAYNSWGSALQGLKKYDEAIAMYQRAIEIDPTFAYPYNNWGQVLYEQKKYDEAISKYQKAIEIHPKYADPYSNWGWVLYEQKKYDEAIAKYQKAVEIDPKFGDAYNNWGLALEKLGRGSEAQEEFARFRELQ